MVPGNSVRVVRNGDVFDVLEEEISRATRSVHLVLFIWRPGAPSDRITEALVERARSGVKCRVMIDPFWSVDFQSRVQPQLEAAGCAVHVYKPLREVTGLGELVQRQHRKLVVVDGKVAITGGFGIWKSWLGNGAAEDEWRDMAVVFRGPVVGQAQHVFAADWRELTGEPLEPESYPELPFEGTTRAMFIGSATPEDRDAPSNAQRLHAWLIGEARERVWISNSYFVPSEALRDLLLERAAAKVDVQVVVPGDQHDMPIVQAAQRSLYARLTEGGVRLWEYQPSMMHSKTMVVDGRYAVIGSINLDPMSLRQSRECALLVDDPQIAAELAGDFTIDQARSMEIREMSNEPSLGVMWLVMWFLGNL